MSDNPNPFNRNARTVTMMTTAALSTCATQGCEATPTHTPVLEFRVHRQHPPAEARVGLSLCSVCADAFDLAAFLGSGGFEKISDMLALAGKQRPSRELTTVHMERLQ